MNPKFINKIKEMQFNVFSLANNHIMDYGVEGLQDTIEVCKKNNIQYCGAGNNISEAIKPTIIQIGNSEKIAIFSFCEREFGVANDESPGAAWISDPRTFEEITKIRQTVDIIIVIAHGGIENVPLPPLERQILLRKFIDIGADFVIGHHSHVAQGWEKYKKGFIFYSVGNFLFEYPSAISSRNKQWGEVVSIDMQGASLISLNVILFGNQENIVEIMKQDHNPNDHHKMLLHLCEIIIDPKLYKQYWQELALILYSNMYQVLLKRRYGFNKYFFYFYEKIGSYILNRKFEIKSLNTFNDLLLLNLMRNESHSCTIIQALSVITSIEPYSHNKQIETELKDLIRDYY